MRRATVAAAMIAGACARPGPTLESDEARLAGRPATYRGFTRGARFRPSGAYWDDGRLWLYARDHREQVGFQRLADGWARAGTRRGPRRTVACVSVPGPAGCWCVGAREPGGLRACRGRTVTPPALPRRGGYVAIARGAEDLLVLDGPGARVYRLGFEGRLRDALGVRPGTYAMTAGRTRVWLAAGTPPRLYGLSGDGTRLDIERRAPVRALRYDPAREVLWVVGPNAGPVRRKAGPLTNLYSRLDGYALRGGSPARRYAVDLRRADLVDATDVALWGDKVVVAATGSRAVGVYDPQQNTLTRIEVGLAPSGLAPRGPLLAVVNRLDDTVQVVDATGGATRLAVSPSWSPDLGELGEILFYDKVLWSEQDRFTCNSCHWDGGTDHRIHPGFKETRWALTRPLEGLGMVAPVFTPMQAPTLSHAVRGFFEALDRRWWAEGRAPPAPLSISLRGVTHRVSVARAQRALLHFLMTRPVERGPWRRADGTFDDRSVAGARLFLRDCARCHEPTLDMRARRRVAPAAFLATLVERPLVLGAPFFVPTGIQPRQHRRGHRVSPLRALGRGGPFFSNGAARDLDDALRWTHPHARQAHAPEHAIAPYYDEAERAAIAAFLLSL